MAWEDEGGDAGELREEAAGQADRNEWILSGMILYGKISEQDLEREWLGIRWEEVGKQRGGLPENARFQCRS